MRFWLLGLFSLSLLVLNGCGDEMQNGGLGDIREPIHILLQEHESQDGQRLGHTIERHVAKSDEYLRDRLLNNQKLNTVSTFSSIKMAEASINAVLNMQRQQVAAWWQSDLARQAFFARVPTHGSYLTRDILQQEGDGARSHPIPDMAVVRVVLARQGDGFYLLTAFPQPD